MINIFIIPHSYKIIKYPKQYFWKYYWMDLNCTSLLTHGFLFQLIGAVQTLLFRGQFRGWESPYADSWPYLQAGFQLCERSTPRTLPKTRTVQGSTAGSKTSKSYMLSATTNTFLQIKHFQGLERKYANSKSNDAWVKQSWGESQICQL